MSDERRRLLDPATHTTKSSTTYVNEGSDSTSTQQEQWADLIPHLPSLLASCFMSIIVGLNDGAIGFMIPQFKKYYGVDNRILSFLFLSNAAGYIICAPLNGLVVRRLGQKATLYLAGTCTLLAYLLIMNGFDFRLTCLLMVFQGSGVALLDAGMNVLTVDLPFATMMLNVVHALYGVGGMISPIVGTSLLEHNLSWKWLYGFLSLASLINLVVISVGLRNLDLDLPGSDAEIIVGSSVNERETITAEMEASAKEDILQAILNRTTLLCAGYVLVYVGLEVTLGGWGYTYLVEGKHGDVISMGRVLSMYWASLAFGRIVLGYLSGKYGEKASVNVYTFLVLVGVICIWQVDDILVDSIVYIFIGALLGPMFPNAIALASKTLPKESHASAIGLIAGVGASGAAFLPFLTGQITGHFGMLCLPIVALVMIVTMELIWLFIPS
ncbi:major facilitator superfamily domain-containing protein [Chlamydoabsidia padenii]|nr:major facilitator superfamily domain-containing protein [Chlamydoabsidia padenii]